jgi:hypothetical protein
MVNKIYSSLNNINLEDPVNTDDSGFRINGEADAEPQQAPGGANRSASPPNRAKHVGAGRSV